MRVTFALILVFTCSPLGWAQEATFTIKHITPETALKAAQGALAPCRVAGSRLPSRWSTGLA